MSAQGPDNNIQQLIKKHTSPDGLTLDLSHRNGVALLLGNDIQALAEVLPQMRIITLDLSANILGNNCAQTLAEVLPRTQITTLDLSTNLIGDKGVEALISALPNTMVTTLKFLDNLNCLDSSFRLKAALELNKLKISLVPRLLESLHYLPEVEKQSQIPRPALNSVIPYPEPNMFSNDELIFAAGIYAHLPDGVRDNVLKFLPMMNEDKASKIIRQLKERYPEDSGSSAAASGEEEVEGDLETARSLVAGSGKEEVDDGLEAAASSAAAALDNEEGDDWQAILAQRWGARRRARRKAEVRDVASADTLTSLTVEQHDEEDGDYDAQEQSRPKKCFRTN